MDRAAEVHRTLARGLASPAPGGYEGVVWKSAATRSLGEVDHGAGLEVVQHGWRLRLDGVGLSGLPCTEHGNPAAGRSS